MNTFLPASYRFSLSKLLDVKEIMYTKNSIEVYLLWILALLSFLGLIGMSIHISGRKVHLIAPESWFDGFSRVMVCAEIIFFGTMAVNPYPLMYSSYTSQQFKCTDKGNLSVRMLANNPHPTKIDDHKPYPYKLYYNEKGDGYLGVMTNGKFTPGTEEPAPTFYKYYQYIQQHKLADKFKHDATLKRDGRYQTRNGKAQWVLTNNRDATLHFTDNTNVEQAHVVEN